jgi:hypothetical protein
VNGHPCAQRTGGPFNPETVTSGSPAQVQVPAAAVAPPSDPQQPAGPVAQPKTFATIALANWLKPFTFLARTVATSPFKALAPLVFIATVALGYPYVIRFPAPEPQPSPPGIPKPSDYLGLEWPPLPSDVPLVQPGPPLPKPNPQRETPETIQGTVYKFMLACLYALPQSSVPFACIPKGREVHRVGADVFLRVRSPAGFAIRMNRENFFTTRSLCKEHTEGDCELTELRFLRPGGATGTIPIFKHKLPPNLFEAFQKPRAP